MNTEPMEQEKIENIGTLRVLEYGIPIYYDIVEGNSLLVYTPEDFEYIKKILEKYIREMYYEARKNTGLYIAGWGILD